MSLQSLRTTNTTTTTTTRNIKLSATRSHQPRRCDRS